MTVDKIKTSPQSPPPPASEGENDAGVTSTDASGEKKTKHKKHKPGNAGSTEATMAQTTKRQRRFSQDFSGKSLTDQSFAPGCNVNNIVNHYERTGLDPHQDRKKLERFEEATTQTFDEAMRNHAEAQSAIAERGNDPANWPDLIHQPEPPPEPSQDPQIDPPPEATERGDKGD